MLEILNITLGPVVSLLGIIFGYKLLKSKLVENNITTTLNLIQETNRKTNRSCQQLIDETNMLRRSREIHVNKDDLQRIYKRVVDIYYEALDGSGECATYLHLLKTALQAYLGTYNDKDHHFEHPSLIYSFIGNVLDDVIFYCTQAVSVPRSTRISKQKLIHKQIAGYVKHSIYSKYKHFNTGVIPDNRSAHYVLFFEHMNRSTVLLNIAASNFLNLSRSIQVYLYRKSIYAPVKLAAQGIATIFDDFSKLDLIRIQIDAVYGKEVKQIVKLTYRNIGFGSFLEKLDQQYIRENFFDTTFPGEDISLNGYSEYKYEGNEACTITIDKNILEGYFKQLKPQIERKLKVR